MCSNECSRLLQDIQILRDRAGALNLQLTEASIHFQRYFNHAAQNSASVAPSPLVLQLAAAHEQLENLNRQIAQRTV